MKSFAGFVFTFARNHARSIAATSTAAGTLVAMTHAVSALTTFRTPNTKNHSSNSFDTFNGSSFEIQAAAIPKNVMSVNDMITVAPDEDTVSLAGEDAFCIRTITDIHANNNCTTTKWIAIADGVGGWNKHQINPAKFSNSLMRNLWAALERTNNEDEGNPMQFLHRAYQGLLREVFVTEEKDAKPLGSSTACLLKLQEGGVVSAVNLGDSGFMLLRPSEDRDTAIILARSQPQQSRFNCPYQLRYTPEGSYQDITGSKSEQFTYSLRRPSHFLRNPKNDVVLQPGDVIVVASDGLWDNLYASDISAIVNKNVNTDLASELALAAYELSLDEERRSPFSDEYNATHQGEKERKGGKVDDITVIVAKIK